MNQIDGVPIANVWPTGLRVVAVELFTFARVKYWLPILTCPPVDGRFVKSADNVLVVLSVTAAESGAVKANSGVVFT